MPSPSLSLELAFLPSAAADLDRELDLDWDAERRRPDLSADRERDWDGERLEDAVPLVMVLPPFLSSWGPSERGWGLVEGTQRRARPFSARQLLRFGHSTTNPSANSC